MTDTLSSFLSYGMSAVPLVNASAFLVCLTLAMRYAKHQRLDPAVMYWAGLFGIVGALIGGHLAFGAFVTIGNTAQAWHWLDLLSGGKSIFGALAGAALCSGAYLYIRRVNAVRYAEAALPAMAMGYATARLGCFLNGDDFGILSGVPWAVRFPMGTEAFSTHEQMGWLHPEAVVSLPVHPVQLYHLALGLVLFVLLSRVPRQTGIPLSTAMLGYGLGRFLLQFLRYDHGPRTFTIDTTQWCCIGLVFAGAAIWSRVNGNRTDGREHGPAVSRGVI